jgi:hypothetical protein
MLIPQPESDLTQSTFFLGAEILSALRSRKSFAVIEEVMDGFLKKDPKRTAESFVDALTFLYASGVLEVQGYKVKVIARDAYTQSSLF